MEDEQKGLSRFMSPEKMESFRQLALDSMFHGIPIRTMTQGEQLAVLGFLGQELDLVRQKLLGDLRVLSGESREG